MIHSHRLLSAGLAIAACTALPLSACGSKGGTGASGGGGGVKPPGNVTTTTGRAGPIPTTPVPSKAVNVTVQAGYQYQVSAGPVVTAPTEGSTDAPPGKEFLQTTLIIHNATDRVEPLNGLVSSGGGMNDVGVILAIPLANAGAFGVQCAAVSSPGTNSGGVTNAATAALVPAGYCLLNTEVGTISGSSSGDPGTVQMNPGDNDQAVVFAAEQVDQANLPLQDVAVFAGNRAPGQQLLGPVAPALAGPSGVPVWALTVGQVLFFSRGPIQTAPAPNGAAGTMQYVTHVTITNPTPEQVDVSRLFNSGVPDSASNVLSFTIPTADIAPSSSGTSGCDAILNAPADSPCTIAAFVSPSATSTIPPGGSETIKITGGTVAAPVQDVKVTYTDPQHQFSTEIPQQAG